MGKNSVGGAAVPLPFARSVLASVCRWFDGVRVCVEWAVFLDYAVLEENYKLRFDHTVFSFLH